MIMRCGCHGLGIAGRLVGRVSMGRVQRRCLVTRRDVPSE